MVPSLTAATTTLFTAYFRRRTTKRKTPPSLSIFTISLPELLHHAGMSIMTPGSEAVASIASPTLISLIALLTLTTAIGHNTLLGPKT